MSEDKHNTEGIAYVLMYVDKSTGSVGLAEDVTFMLAESIVKGRDNEELVDKLNDNMVGFFSELLTYCRACRVHLAHHSGLPLVPANFPEEALKEMTSITMEKIDQMILDANNQAALMGMDYHEHFHDENDEDF